MNTESLTTEAHPLESEVQILVFRSDINSSAKAALVLDELRKMQDIIEANVDLHDWENILRVACYPTCRASQIENKLSQLGFKCNELAD